MCKHMDDNGIALFEIKQKKGQSPLYICKLCHGSFNQFQAEAILEGLL